MQLTGTVFGNVDGFNDPFTWDGEIFNAVADTPTWTPGSYCFVFNPTESQGDGPNIITTPLKIYSKLKI